MRVDARVRHVGLGRRLMSGLFDMALIAFFTAVIGMVYLAFQAGGVTPSSFDSIATGTDFALGSLPPVLLAVLVTMQCVCWWRLGGTPGMLALECVVVDSRTGRRLSLARSVLRCVVLWLGMVALGAGVLWVLKDSRRRGWHDLAARSVVLREDESLMALEELTEQIR